MRPLAASVIPLDHFSVETLYAKLSRIGMVSADMKLTDEQIDELVAREELRLAQWLADDRDECDGVSNADGVQTMTTGYWGKGEY
jgi:hypothetical protein